MNREEEYIQLKNNPGAIINTDIDGLNTYREKRRQYLLGLTLKEEKSEINILKDDIDLLKNQMSNIQKLLLKVLESK